MMRARLGLACAALWVLVCSGVRAQPVTPEPPFDELAQALREASGSATAATSPAATTAQWAALREVLRRASRVRDRATTWRAQAHVQEGGFSGRGVVDKYGGYGWLLLEAEARATALPREASGPLVEATTAELESLVDALAGLEREARATTDMLVASSALHPFEVSAAYACYRLNHLPSSCAVDEDCTAVRAGCDTVAADQAHALEAERLSERCTALCGMSVSRTWAAGECRAHRCVSRDYPVSLTPIALCAARSKARGVPMPTPVSAELQFDANGRLKDVRALGVDRRLGACLRWAVLERSTATGAPDERRVVTLSTMPEKASPMPAVHYQSTTPPAPPKSSPATTP